MLLLTAAAMAGTIVGATGTADVAVGQTLTGLELAALGDQTQGFRPHIRVLAGVDLVDRAPTGTTELGFTGVAPSENTAATIRAGVFARIDHLIRDRRIALQFGSTDQGTARYGMALAGAAMAELAWTPEAPLVVGAHLGFGHWQGVLPDCLAVDRLPDELPEGCIAWPVSIIGGAYVRKSFRSGLTLRASVGTTFEVGVGYRFE